MSAGQRHWIWAAASAVVTLSAAVGASAQTQASKPASAPAVSHSAWDELLKKHVKADGVDYAALKKEADKLNRYLESLASVKSDALPGDDRIALWINAYNACTLRLVLDHYPIRAVTDIPAEKRWKDARWKIAGQTLSLDQIENERLGAAHGEPRAYFALHRGCRGSPPLRNEAYDAEALRDQLDDQAQRVHRDERLVRFDAGRSEVHLTRLYEWHAGDFKKHSDSVLPFVAQYVPELAAALRKDKVVSIRWIECDWTLDDVPSKEAGAAPPKKPAP